MKAADVSVCLTAYNRGRALPKTIESLLGQDRSLLELVITDDASTDDTQAVCLDYAARDSRVRYYRNPQRVGMPGNLNRAISLSSGTFVANCHDGDVYRRDFLGKCRDALAGQPDAAFVFSDYLSVRANGLEVLDGHSAEFPERFESRELVGVMLRRLTSPIWGTVVGRRACYDAVGLFNPRFSWYSDVEMWMRLNLHYAVLYIREPLVRLTPHETDRPYAKIDWGHEQILVAMHEETIQRMYTSLPVEAAMARRRLRRIKRRRWCYQLACLAKQGCLDGYREGLKVFRQEDAGTLKTLGVLGELLVPLVARRVAS